MWVREREFTRSFADRAPTELNPTKVRVSILLFNCVHDADLSYHPLRIIVLERGEVLRCENLGGHVSSSG